MAKSQLRIGAVLSYINIIVGALKYIFYDSIIFSTYLSKLALRVVLQVITGRYNLVFD